MNYIFVLIFGLIIGSFLNVCIYRIPLEQSISYPSSHCSSCNHKLSPLDLVPVFSYLFLKGRCKYCKEKISLQYPIIELLNSALYVIIFYNYGLTFEFFKYIILSSLLIVIGMIDYKTQDVYTSTIIFGFIIGIALIIVDAIIYKNSISNMIIGGLIGFLFIGAIVILTKGMGEGDIQIASVCGLFLGARGILVALFLAVVLCGVFASIILLLKIKNSKDKIAFGPYIALGSVISMIWCNEILNWYCTLLL